VGVDVGVWVEVLVDVGVWVCVGVNVGVAVGVIVAVSEGVCVFNKALANSIQPVGWLAA